MICCKTMYLPKNPVAAFLFILLVAFSLGAAYLWLKDYLYTWTTGKPESERVRERMERLNAPLSSGQYRFRLVLFSVCIVLCGSALFSHEFNASHKLRSSWMDAQRRVWPSKSHSPMEATEFDRGSLVGGNVVAGAGAKFEILVFCVN